MVTRLLLFTLSDAGTIASVVSAAAAMVATGVAVSQARRARGSAEAAKRSVAAAEGQAQSAQRAAVATEEQAAALREGLARQERRDQEQRDLAFPRLNVDAVDLADASITVRHVSGQNPATSVHVVLITLTERSEGELRLLPAGATASCRVERVKAGWVDYFPECTSVLGAPFRMFAGIIWTSPTGGCGRFAVTFADGGTQTIAVDSVDANIPGY